MNKRLNILLVYPEIAPFVKTNDIAEAGGSLPLVLKDLGHDVRLITPKYRVINERKYILRDVIRLQNISVPLGGEKVEINVKSAFVPDSKVQVYFIDYKPHFSRKGIYRDIETNKLFSDNAERFILFTYGILETLKKLQWQPDVIHCNGWQSGLVPFLLKTKYKDDEFFKNVYTMFTIHDLGEDGVFESSCLNELALEDPADLVRDDKFSFLTAGIKFSDKVNATSGKVADFFARDKKNIAVIPPGAGTDLWNPKTDKKIEKQFSGEDYVDRGENRIAILENLGVKLDDNVPIIMICEECAGSDFMELISKDSSKVSKLGAYFLFLCNSEARAAEITQAVKKNPECFVVTHAAEGLDFQQVCAGADLILYNSDYPLSGISMFRSMIYGVVPLIYDLTGIKEFLHPISNSEEIGDSFIIEKLTSDNVFKTIKLAVKTYNNKDVWKQVVGNCLNSPLTWAAAAKKYVCEYFDCAE